jgi:hypothetical protein
MQKMTLALVALLGIMGVGRAGDKEILQRLKEGGADVSWVHEYDGRGGHVILSRVWFDRDNPHADLSELCQLRGLESLTLLDRLVSLPEMQAVGGQPRLCNLILDGCSVGDAHLKELKELRSLRYLSLKHSLITNAGLAELRKVPKLWFLDLSDTAITDDGLRRLEGLKELQVLRLNKCPTVTAEGVARLKKALPGCQIDR